MELLLLGIAIVVFSFALLGLYKTNADFNDPEPEFLVWVVVIFFGVSCVAGWLFVHYIIPPALVVCWFAAIAGWLTLAVLECPGCTTGDGISRRERFDEGFFVPLAIGTLCFASLALAGVLLGRGLRRSPRSRAIELSV